MKRRALIALLKDVQPATADPDLLPLLAQFYFTGEDVLAFNDQIALAHSCVTRMRGAVPRKLLPLIEKTGKGDDDLDLDVSDKTLTVRSGHERLRIQVATEPFIFSMPEPRGRPLGNGALDELIAAMEHCLLSVTTDATYVENLGVTLEPERDRIVVYATDQASISRAYAKGPDNLRLTERVILPAEFARQLVRLARAKEQASFEISQRQRKNMVERYALFAIGKTRLYGRMFATRHPLNFTEVLAYAWPKQSVSRLSPVPAAFWGGLERARLICGKQGKARIIVAGGRLTLLSRSDREEAKDEMSVRHADVEVSVNPELLLRGKHFHRIMIAPRCVVLGNTEDGAGMVYVVSVA